MARRVCINADWVFLKARTEVSGPISAKLATQSAEHAISMRLIVLLAIVTFICLGRLVILHALFLTISPTMPHGNV